MRHPQDALYSPLQQRIRLARGIARCERVDERRLAYDALFLSGAPWKLRHPGQSTSGLRERQSVWSRHAFSREDPYKRLLQVVLDAIYGFPDPPARLQLDR